MLSTDLAVQMVPSGQSITWTELSARAERFARFLKAHDVNRLVLLLENRLECAELLRGAELAGVDHILLNTHLPAEDLVDMIDAFWPDMFIFSDRYKDKAEQVLVRTAVDLIFEIDGAPGEWGPYKTAYDWVDKELDLPGGGRLLPTSGGTTGQPKIVLLPESAGLGVALGSKFGYEPEDVVLIAGPVHHGFHSMSLGMALASNVPVVFMEGWDERQFLEVVERFEITCTNLVPAMMSKLLELPKDEREAFDLSTLRRVVHAAAPCPVEIKRQFLDWFGDCVVELYGMSELFGLTYITAAESRERPGSVGRALPGFRIVIRDDDGNELPPGTPGIVWFARDDTDGRTSYLGDPEESSRCYNDQGEGTSRDVGYVDDDGYLYLTDRDKRMIITGGANIYPGPTDQWLCNHPAVADAWCFGASHTQLGERLRALVQLKPGVEQTEQLAHELISFCADQFDRFAVPDRIVFVDKLPRTPSGKMDMRLVAELETAAS